MLPPDVFVINFLFVILQNIQSPLENRHIDFCSNLIMFSYSLELNKRVHFQKIMI